MPEGQDSQDAAKEVAFYSTVVGAWVATRMEKDKTLLSLASGGIGLLATLLTTVGPSSSSELALYGAAGASFVVSVIAAIRVFERNSHHLEAVVRNNTRGDDPKLKRLDGLLCWSFLLGVVLTGAIAMSSGYARMRKDMSVPQNDRETTKATGGSEQRSLTGIGSLAPATPAPQPAASGATQASAGAGTHAGSGTSSGPGGSTQGSEK